MTGNQVQNVICAQRAAVWCEAVTGLFWKYTPRALHRKPMVSKM